MTAGGNYGTLQKNLYSGSLDGGSYFGATRLAGDKALMLGLIEALMVLIAAFVGLKTIDLIFPPKKADDDS